MQGRIERRELLARIAGLSGAALAVALVPIIERHAASAAVPPRAVAMLSLGEMSDRLEIQKNLWDYAIAVDTKDFAALDGVFTEDAKLDYGRGIMSRAEAKDWLARSLGRPEIRGYYHLMGHMRIRMLGDDEAESLTACYNPMEFLQPDGRASLWLNGIFYSWRHLRTAAGWRITKRLPNSSGLKGYRYSLPPLDSADMLPMIR